MTFLNPSFLIALPLIAIPVLIHLINQRRHKTVEWGAMRFLLSAKRMSKGMAQLRHLAILTMRMLVLAGLVFAVSRPLATGWFGALTRGQAETVIILLDRSASMQQQQLETGRSKLSSSLDKVIQMLEVGENSKRIVLIDSASGQPLEVASSQALRNLSQTTATDASCDIPELMKAALDYITENQCGRTDIWVCSDASKNDWDAENSEWKSFQSAFAQLDGVRFHVLNYSEKPTQNFSVTADNVRLVESPGKNEIVMDISVKRSPDIQGEHTVPIELSINGARTVIQVRTNNETYFLAGHRVPVDANTKAGWGKLELAADSNASDNTHYFSFAQQPERQTVIVTETPELVDPLRVICSIPLDSGIQLRSKVVTPDRLQELDWDATTLLIWQAPLPTSIAARQIKGFVEQGRSVIFFPPLNATNAEIFGHQWGPWGELADKPHWVGDWQNDDLLRKTQNGRPLPLNELKIQRYCRLLGGGRALARLENGAPLLARKASDSGSVYFCATLPDQPHSSMASSGVVIFAILHRALDLGSAAIGRAQQLNAGSTLARRTSKMRPVANEPHKPLAAERPFLAGVYEKDGRYVALNCPQVEHRANPLSSSETQALFAGLDAHLIEDRLDNTKSLASEIWKIFVLIMGLALLAEAIICLPRKGAAPQSGLRSGLSSMGAQS